MKKRKHAASKPKNRETTLENLRAEHRALDEQVTQLSLEYQQTPTPARRDEIAKLKSRKCTLKGRIDRLAKNLPPAAAVIETVSAADTEASIAEPLVEALQEEPRVEFRSRRVA